MICYSCAHLAYVELLCHVLAQGSQRAQRPLLSADKCHLGQGRPRRERVALAQRAALLDHL